MGTRNTHRWSESPRTQEIAKHFSGCPGIFAVLIAGRAPQRLLMRIPNTGKYGKIFTWTTRDIQDIFPQESFGGQQNRNFTLTKHGIIA